MGGDVSVTMSFEVSKDVQHSKPPILCLVLVDQDIRSQLLLQAQGCLPAVVLLAMMAVDFSP